MTPDDGINWAPKLGTPQSGQIRWVISVLGIVVLVLYLPTGQLPSLSLGQTSTMNLTLQIGDRVP